MKVNTDAYYTEMQTEVVNQLKNVNEYNPDDVLIKMRKNCKNFDDTFKYGTTTPLLQKLATSS